MLRIKLTTAHFLKEWLLWATIIFNNSWNKMDMTAHTHKHLHEPLTDQEHCPQYPRVNVYVCTYGGVLYWTRWHLWDG